MGKVTILDETPKDVITLIGKCIGPCYGSDTTDSNKNYKRGMNSIKAGHGRALEYANAWFVLEEYSARVIRQFYTHIGGSPTRTQASTRYINYDKFNIVIPPKIQKDIVCLGAYLDCMDHISKTVKFLEDQNIPKEDTANLLPLGMTTTVSIHMNARTLMSMAEQRLCNRAYWEYRNLMRDILSALGEYSSEWKELTKLMICKCDKVGWCEEEFCCGKRPRKKNIEVVDKKDN